MVVYDESGELIEEYDLEKGYLESKSEPVEHRWVVDSAERGEWVTVNEYPETGGKDVEWSVTAAEVGHWKTVDAEGNEVADFDGPISDDWPHDAAIPDVFEFAVYHPYTEDELAQIEADKAEAQARVLRQRQAEEAASMYVQSLALPRAQAVSVCMLYPDWDGGGVQYEAGQWVRYGGDLYRVEQAHTSQPDWMPDAAPSLYTRIEMCPDGIRLWAAPTHAENAWDKGETCHYPDADGPVYRSTMDGNTTEPTKPGAMWEAVE